MGKHSTYRTRGRFQDQSSALAAPVLDFGLDPNVVVWTWAGGDPVTWSVENGPAPTGPWSVFDQVDGSLRGDTGIDSGQYYTVIGLDAGFSPVTSRSNAILMP